LRDRLQHGLRGVHQFLRHEVGDHVGPSPHVLSSLVVVVLAVNLQLKPLSINVRQKRLVWAPKDSIIRTKHAPANHSPHASVMATSCSLDYGSVIVLFTTIVVIIIHVINVATKNLIYAHIFFGHENLHGISVPILQFDLCLIKYMCIKKMIILIKILHLCAQSHLMI